MTDKNALPQWLAAHAALALLVAVSCCRRAETNMDASIAIRIKEIAYGERASYLISEVTLTNNGAYCAIYYSYELNWKLYATVTNAGSVPSRMAKAISKSADARSGDNFDHKELGWSEENGIRVYVFARNDTRTVHPPSIVQFLEAAYRAR